MGTIDDIHLPLYFVGMALDVNYDKAWHRRVRPFKHKMTPFSSQSVAQVMVMSYSGRWDVYGQRLARPSEVSGAYTFNRARKVRLGLIQCLQPEMWAGMVRNSILLLDRL